MYVAWNSFSFHLSSFVSSLRVFVLPVLPVILPLVRRPAPKGERLPPSADCRIQSRPAQRHLASVVAIVRSAAAFALATSRGEEEHAARRISVRLVVVVVVVIIPARRIHYSNSHCSHDVRHRRADDDRRPEAPGRCQGVGSVEEQDAAQASSEGGTVRATAPEEKVAAAPYLRGKKDERNERNVLLFHDVVPHCYQY